MVERGGEGGRGGREETLELDRVGGRVGAEQGEGEGVGGVEQGEVGSGEYRGESVEWLNCLLKETWPALHQQLASFLTSTLAASPFPGVHLSNLKLGGSPRVGRVRVSENCLETSVSYFGGGGVEVALPLPGPIPQLTLAVSDLHLEAKVIVHLLPEVQLQLLEQPYLDFNFGGLASCLNLPGIATLTRHIVAEQIFQNLKGLNLLPPKPMLPTRSPTRRSTNPAPPAGVLNITVVAAEALSCPSSCLLLELTLDGRLHRFRTSANSKSTSPSWDFLVQLPVEQVESISDLTIKMEEEEGMSRATTTLSKTVVDRALTMGEVDFWSSLDDADGKASQVSGRVRTRISWSTLGTQPSEQALVTVNLISCSSLPPGNLVVSFTLGSVTQVSTTSVSSNGQPVFDDRILLLVDNPEEENLRVDVVNLSTERVVGFLKIPLGVVLANKGGCLQEQELSLQQRTEVDDDWVDNMRDKETTRPTVSLSLVVNYMNHSMSVLRSRSRCRAQNQGRLRGKSERQEERVKRIREEEEKEESAMKSEEEEKKESVKKDTASEEEQKEKVNQSTVASEHFEEGGENRDTKEITMGTAEGQKRKPDDVEAKGNGVIVNGNELGKNGHRETDEIESTHAGESNDRDREKGKRRSWTSVKNVVLEKRQNNIAKARMFLERTDESEVNDKAITGDEQPFAGDTKANCNGNFGGLSPFENIHILGM